MGIEITSPLPGTVFAPGDLIEVTVESTGGATLDRVLVSTEFEAALLQLAPFTVQFQVPDEAIGAMTLSAVAVDVKGTMLEAIQVPFTVETLDRLVSLRIHTDPIRLQAHAPSHQLRVTGTYDSGAERDLTDPTLGTTFTTPGPTAAVDAKGFVTAREAGSTVVVASNGGVEASASVYVEHPAPYLFKPLPAEPGAPSAFKVTGAKAGSTLRLYRGSARGTTTLSPCPSSPLGIESAEFLGKRLAQGGEDTIQATIPAEDEGKTVFFQVMESGTCRTTAVLVYAFGNDPG